MTGEAAATATRLRKLISPSSAIASGSSPGASGGGNGSYEREDRSPKVRIDFGGRGDQLRYSVTATDPASGGRVAMATHEGLLGLFGGWDLIVEEEAASAVDLLAELVGVIESVPPKLSADTRLHIPPDNQAGHDRLAQTSGKVGGTGLEPVTPSLSSWCSPN